MGGQVTAGALPPPAAPTVGSFTSHIQDSLLWEVDRLLQLPRLGGVSRGGCCFCAPGTNGRGATVLILGLGVISPQMDHTLIPGRLCSWRSSSLLPPAP